MEPAELLIQVFIVYGQITAIMNPFTAVNNFLMLTERMDPRETREVLHKAMVVVLILGSLFIFAGRLILEFYHVSLSALRLGGGILLLYISIDMLSGSPRTRSVEPEEVAVVPFATPMIVGPGTMTLLINLGTQHDPLVVYASFLLAAGTITVFLYAARFVERVLGKNGVKAMARFMALIIAGVAAEMIKSALSDWACTIAEAIGKCSG